MKYFLDTEFLEGPQKKLFGYTKPTIDLISIGIVSETGDHKFYAISKDFNLKEAWNRYDKKVNKLYPTGPMYLKEYWIRDNVLRPIFDELVVDYNAAAYNSEIHDFTYSNLKKLINRYGLPNKEIARQIVSFCSIGEEKPEFYAYYADYDWVAFCWLFGKMIDLPKGFPMYCKDLKQEFDFYNENFKKRKALNALPSNQILRDISCYKEHSNYPKQENEHNALDDAKWNLELYNFLYSL